MLSVSHSMGLAAPGHMEHQLSRHLCFVVWCQTGHNYRHQSSHIPKHRLHSVCVSIVLHAMSYHTAPYSILIIKHKLYHATCMPFIIKHFWRSLHRQIITTMDFTWISNYNHGFLWDVIIPTCPNFNNWLADCTIITAWRNNPTLFSVCSYLSFP